MKFLCSMIFLVTVFLPLTAKEIFAFGPDVP